MNKKEYQQTVSVIVPVYNGESYLKQCLRSICMQSLRDLEIIVVDDGSKDGSAEIVKKIAAEDPRVILCQHEQNMGLFQARITGVEASHGEYIGFVDADDEISIDWFRLLYQTATEQKNDITVGQFFEKFSDGRLEYLNLDPLRQEVHWEGDVVFQHYIEQEGTFYSWQLVWNKLYSRSLWMDVLDDVKEFSKNNPRFVMCEDMAFSAALWLRAKKVGNFTQGAVYYYNHFSGASTAVTKNRETNLKKIRDVISAFDFMEAQMKKCGTFEANREHLQKWKLDYAKMYYGFLCDCKTKSPREEAEFICEAFRVTEKELQKDTPERSYFYTIRSAVNRAAFNQMEELKEKLCSDPIRVVSFDVFDTLVVRPFLNPTDLFSLLNDEFAKLCNLNSYVNFSEIRVNSEAKCRTRITGTNISYEEITLDEIYEQIALDYNIDANALEALKQKEIQLELRFCVTREMGKQLLELAQSQGKQVVITSDMYLPKETVEAILQKNGYTYNKLYLSSELRVAKWTKNLFYYIRRDLGLPTKCFLHIGDNYQSDVLNPKEAGWESAQLAKPSDLLKNAVPLLYGGEFYARSLYYHGLMRDGLNAESMFLGYRCALALVANKFYDNPFATVAKDSDFDADPYKIGYYAVGHYLYAITNWVIQKAKGRQAEKIHFVARDGYLPMEAYRIFKDYDPTLPEDNYLYISRKALALVDVYNEMDLYSFWSKYPASNYSPYKFDEILRPFYKDGIQSVKQIRDDGDAIYRKHFQNRVEYDQAIKNLTACVDFEKVNAYKSFLREYFTGIIGENNLLFDIGYSGRGEAALSKLLGHPVNGLYVHNNSQSVSDRERMFGFRTECFYDYKPAITGVVREHVFMKQAPSTIGYEEQNGVVNPTFEKFKYNAAESVMTSMMQGAALDFVRDMCSVFEGYTDVLAYRKDDLAFSFEYYLHYSKPTDRKVFGCVVFEDEMGVGKAFSALDFWNNDLKMFRLDRLFSADSLGIPTQVDNLRNSSPYSFRATARQIMKAVKGYLRSKFFLRPHIAVLEKSSLFDAEWYLKTYPDVKRAKLDPIRHYLLFGWRELRDPSAEFSTRRYLERNPDVLAQGICPLLHYELNGKKEHREI